MTEPLIALTLLAVMAVFILNCACLAYVLDIRKSVRVRLNYLTEQSETAKKQLDTVGRVLHIIEDETKILQKRRDEQQVVRSRFTRQPR